MTLAGSSPTRTTSRPGARPCFSRNAVTPARTSPLTTSASCLPSRTRAPIVRRSVTPVAGCGDVRAAVPRALSSAAHVNQRGKPDHGDAEELRRGEPEHPPTLVPTQKLDGEPRDRVKDEEAREDLPVVALARVNDDQADGG